MLFVILIGAMIFANYINYTTMPGDLRTFVHQFEIRPLVVIAAICVIYIALGCVLESISMILLTVPVFYPLVQHLGYDLVWFGIIVVVVTEISLITPPVGMNVFVLRTLLPDVPTRTVFRGVMPFIVADFFRLALLIGVPAISLLLPRFMG
jgi:TRAP-type C4-dicarboxylate transport system permease large subunit